MRTTIFTTILATLFFYPSIGFSQIEEVEDIQQARPDQSLSEDDHDWQEKDFFRRTRLNLNELTEEQLRVTGLLTEEQISQFFLYRKWLGPFIDIYELQAVPGWDVETIRRLLPFLHTSIRPRARLNPNDLLTSGTHSLLIRAGFTGTDSVTSSKFEGTGLRLFVRYQFRCRNRIRWGWVGEKDAGESLFSQSNRRGFDFNSFHFVYKGVRSLEGLFLGDYSVNFGQGLIQWQSLSLGKSSNAIQVFRTSEPVKPYSSSGEYLFYRGMAVVSSFNRWRYTVFLSVKPLHARLETDSVTHRTVIRSVDEAGYHRTSAEISLENSSRLYSAGSQIRFASKSFQIAINLVGHRYKQYYQPRVTRDSISVFMGQNRLNSSLSYQYRIRNFLCFGELAVDQSLQVAQLHALVASLHQRMTASLLIRTIDRSYQALFASSFTDKGTVESEKGIYLGFEYKPSKKIILHAFVDLFKNDWISVSVNRPSPGADQSIQFQYQPVKKAQLILRYRHRNYEENFFQSIDSNGVQYSKKNSWRMDVLIGQGTQVETHLRVETLGIRTESKEEQGGWIGYIESKWQPASHHWRLEARYSLFRTDSYQSRLYARESDMLYSYAIPAFYGWGERGYLLAKLSPGKWFGRKTGRQLDGWLRVGFMAGWEEDTSQFLKKWKKGPYKWDWRAQVLWSF